jgi:hypothetical protein
MTNEIKKHLDGLLVAVKVITRRIKYIVLERGPSVEHIKDYPTAFKNPWDFKHRTI